MKTNPYKLLIEMDIAADYISQEQAVMFAQEYARREISARESPPTINPFCQNKEQNDCDCLVRCMDFTERL
jgi:hypothetical protein